MANPVNAVIMTGSQFDTAITNVTSKVAGAASLSDTLFPNAEPNILKTFSSYTYLWSLGCLSQEQHNSTSYRSDDSSIDYIVLSEGGGNADKRVSTFYGTPEYFINNIEFKQIEGNPTQPVAQMKFEIYEPYSMGLFLQSIQVAAVKAGFTTYTAQAPFVLKLRFTGWTESLADKLSPFVSTTSSEGLTRFYPFTFKSVQITHNETGTIYACTAVPYVMSAYSNINNTVKKTVTVSGKTVGEVLGGKEPKENSLATAMNNYMKEMKQAGVIGEEDQYSILFQDEQGQENSAIADAGFKFDINSGGNMDFTKDKDGYTKAQTQARAAINTAELKSRQFSFDPGGNSSNDFPRTITSIIDQVMLASEYCTKAYLQENFDSDGMVKWYRIRANIKFQTGKIDAKRNSFPMIYEFVVSPYKVHSSKIKNPLAPSLGMSKIRANVKKVYNYSYTGANDDIVKFDINLATTYYQAVFTGLPEKTGGSEAGSKGAAETNDVPRQTAGDNVDQAFRPTGTYRSLLDPEAYNKPGGGAAADSPEVIVARNVQKAFQDTTSQMITRLEIYGDPYWLSDSGLGNYVSSLADSQTNADGTAPYDFTEVRLFLGFKTPIDAPAEGSLYLFPGMGTVYNPFSGTYKVQTVTNIFRDGMFTQQLLLARDIDQQDEDIKKAISDPGLGYYKSAGQEDATKSQDPSGATATPVQPQNAVTSTNLPPVNAVRPTGQ
jgi:hypothetical protein